MVCMSGAMARYAAKLAGLYPSDPLEALFVDEAYEAIFSALNNSGMYGLTPEEVAEKKMTWLKTDLIRLEGFVKRRLTDKSPYIANQTFSVADIGFYTFFSPRKFTCPLNHFTIEEIQTGAPTLWSYIQNLAQTPEIRMCDAKSEEFHSNVGTKVVIQ